MTSGPKNEIIIRPGGKAEQYWKDLWAYRELFFFLTWRDILVRYKQAVIGVVWCLLKPVVTMIVFTVIFGKLAGLPSEGVPYPIFVFAALLPWQFFSNSLTESSNSLITNANLLSKVYFPRFIVPFSSVMVNGVDLMVSFIVLFGLMFWYGYLPGIESLLLPVLLVPAFLASLGMGLWFSAWNVRYRDFKQLVPFLAQFGLFVSPVGFSSSIVPEKWRLLYSLNPMVGVIDGFRWAISGTADHMYLPALALSYVGSTFLFMSGWWYFRRVEHSFADVI